MARAYRHGSLIAITVLLTLPILASGDDAPSSAPSADANAQPADNLPPADTAAADGIISPAQPGDSSMNGDIEDPAFNQYIDLTAIAVAVNDHRPAKILDAALLTAEGERVLFRERKGMSAARLLDIATTLAIDRNDTATLDRLKKVGELRHDQALLDRLQAAAKAAGDNAAAQADFPVDIAKVDLVVLIDLKKWLHEIERAKFSHDADFLAKLETALPTIPSFDDTMKAELQRRIDDAQAAVGEKGSQDAVMDKLTAKSRYPGHSYPYYHHQHYPNYYYQHYPHHVYQQPIYNQPIYNQPVLSNQRTRTYVYPGGMFQRTGPGAWTEYRNQGPPSFYSVVGEDFSSITLWDANRQIYIYLQDGNAGWSTTPSDYQSFASGQFTAG